MFFVYVIQSRKNGNLYIGFTADLDKKLEEHNLGLNLSTKPYCPWFTIYYEACLNEQDARRRENYFKTSQGQRLLKRRLKEYFYHQK
ncbi:MAG: GIY-YIG nuclease family protein [Candidatus Yanofskybacteria bacterium]|nr:GIY-YIG nuclease family protein [Candidatus Yanofskybacteria bacterium]